MTWRWADYGTLILVVLLPIFMLIGFALALPTDAILGMSILILSGIWAVLNRVSGDILRAMWWSAPFLIQPRRLEV